MKVRAYRLGFYGKSRRRPGDVFTLASKGDFSKEWMETLDGPSKLEQSLPAPAPDPARELTSQVPVEQLGAALANKKRGRNPNNGDVVAPSQVRAPKDF